MQSKEDEEPGWKTWRFQMLHLLESSACQQSEETKHEELKPDKFRLQVKHKCLTEVNPALEQFIIGIVGFSSTSNILVKESLFSFPQKDIFQLRYRVAQTQPETWIMQKSRSRVRSFLPWSLTCFDRPWAVFPCQLLPIRAGIVICLLLLLHQNCVFHEPFLEIPFGVYCALSAIWDFSPARRKCPLYEIWSTCFLKSLPKAIISGREDKSLPDSPRMWHLNQTSLKCQFYVDIRAHTNTVFIPQCWD